MLTPESPVGELSHLARPIAKQLATLGIETVRDLLYHFPRRYEDWSNIVPLDELKPGNEVTVRVFVDQIRSWRTKTRKLMITEAVVRDASGSVKVGWFNQQFLAKNIPAGTEVYLAGRVDPRGDWLMTAPMVERVPARNATHNVAGGPTGIRGSIHTAAIIPLYPATERISQKQIRFLMKMALRVVPQITEWLPDPVIKRFEFFHLSGALLALHFPKSQEELDRALERFKFEELLLPQLYSAMMREKIRTERTIVVPFQENLTKEFVQALPFQLTEDQRRTAWEALQDMQKSYPMNRLVEGEVGSGKTVVAAIAALNVIKAKAQVAILAPTEILAVQHYVTLSKMLGDQGVRVALLTANHVRFGGDDGFLFKNIAQKGTACREMIADGMVDLVIGTHALIEDAVSFAKLGLAIIDEQHRFGVRQREALRKKTGGKHTPHLLALSATPIPRTLALAFLGDMAVSQMRSMPSGRAKITTEIATEANRANVYKRMRETVAKGERVYVVCPLIDPSDLVLAARSVVHEEKELEKEFAGQVTILHGRMKPDAREKAMQDFKDGKKPILVSTTVIEVGVDVPLATLIVIINAERFGLAQLHQLRGRVGRGSRPGSCILITGIMGGPPYQRLLAFIDCNDGFELAEKDLALRGPGEVWGTDQSGFPTFRIASVKDQKMMKEARAMADQLIVEIKNYPPLQKRLEDFARARQS